MSYLFHLPILIISTLIVIRIVKFNRLKAHVKATYPSEWDKICSSRIKASKSLKIEANLRESMTRGFLSQQEDPIIKSLTRFDRVMLISVASIIVMQFIYFLSI